MYIVPSSFNAGVYVYYSFKLESRGLCILCLQALMQGFMYIIPSSLKARVYVLEGIESVRTHLNFEIYSVRLLVSMTVGLI